MIVVKAQLFLARFTFAHLLGYKLVWSAHNVMPHQYKFEWLEHYLRSVLLNKSYLIVGHSYNTEADLRKSFPNAHFNYRLILHGHYNGIYKPVGKVTKKSLGIPESTKTFLLLAKNKAYQDEEYFIDKWLEWNSEKAHLIITGSLSGSLLAKARFAPNISIINGFLERSELADILVISDIVALPYNQITTSGAFFLALTFGKPVLASNLPFFQLHMAMDGGLLYDKDQGDLISVFNLTLSREFDKDSIISQQDVYSWGKGGETLAKAFNQSNVEV